MVQLSLGRDEAGGSPRAAMPSTVLFLAANPVRVPALQLGEECRAIEDKIRAAKFCDRIRFRSRWAARPDDLLQALNEDTPSVLHFSGHGAGDQGLCFQSADGSALTVSADGLAQVMQAAGASVTVVVLNACYSEVQAQALVAHVPCVIGMADAIGDEEAIVYASSFYRALAFGKSVANAHQQGIAALALTPGSGRSRDIDLPEAAPCAPPPRLLSRPGTDADCVYIVHGPRATRCKLVIKATLREFNADVLRRVREELRQLTGDLILEITDVDEGSVRLTVALSPTAAKRLAELWATGKMTQICGFDVSAVVELRVAETKAEVALRHERGVALQRRGDTVLRQVVGGGYDTELGADLPGLELVWADCEQYLVRTARRLCGVRADADDLVQDTFLRAMRQGLPADARNVRPWLFRILTNLYRERLRNARTVRRAEPRIVPEELEPDEAIAAIPDADLHAAVSALDPELRTVVELVYLKQMRYREAAAALKLPVGTIGARLMRARVHLREQLTINRSRSQGSDEE